jgi:hypothetical protein
MEEIVTTSTAAGIGTTVTIGTAAPIIVDTTAMRMTIVDRTVERRDMTVIAQALERELQLERIRNLAAVMTTMVVTLAVGTAMRVGRAVPRTALVADH